MPYPRMHSRLSKTRAPGGGERGSRATGGRGEGGDGSERQGPQRPRGEGGSLREGADGVTINIK